MIPAIMCVGDSICSEKLDKFNNEKIGKIPLYERILINLINEGFNKVYIVAKKNISFELNNISSPVDIKYIELSKKNDLRQELNNQHELIKFVSLFEIYFKRQLNFTLWQNIKFYM